MLLGSQTNSELYYTSHSQTCTISVARRTQSVYLVSFLMCMMSRVERWYPCSQALPTTSFWLLAVCKTGEGIISCEWHQCPPGGQRGRGPTARMHLAAGVPSKEQYFNHQ